MTDELGAPWLSFAEIDARLHAEDLDSAALRVVVRVTAAKLAEAIDHLVAIRNANANYPVLMTAAEVDRRMVEVLFLARMWLVDLGR